MSATDELRRMLDERGVEWTKPKSALEYDETDWGRGEWSFCAIEGADEEFDLTAAYVDWCTPEQAVAATLGRERTCTMLRLTDYTCQYMHRYMCSECGEYTEQPTVMGKSEPPRYCPSCGAKVVDDD